jgi:hypothetical protein
MESVIFNDQTLITHMTSKFGEKIKFNENVDPKEFSVEIWCKSVEVMMIETMRDIINESIDD